MPGTAQNEIDLFDISHSNVSQNTLVSAGPYIPVELQTSPNSNQHGIQATGPNVPGGGQSLSVQGVKNDNTALENNLEIITDYIKARMKEMQREKRERRRSCLKKANHISNITLGIILAIVALFWSIYGLYHFSQPANDIALESLKAAEWSNYYNWVWSICPAEQVMNLTTPECDEARNRTVPSPKKPDNFQVQALSYKLARHLATSVNGSREFEYLISNTDETCSFENGRINITACSGFTPWLSSEPNSPFSLLDSRSFTINVTFPLPSPKLRSTMLSLGIRKQFHSLNRFNLFYLALYYIPCLLLLASRLNKPTYKAYSLHLWEFKLHEKVIIASYLYIWGWFLPLTYYYYFGLVSWIAQDTFLDKCLAAKGLLDSSIFPECQHILDMSSHLSNTNQAKLWGIWRGFYFHQIRSLSFDDVSLICLVVLWFAIVTLEYWLVVKYFQRWLWERAGVIGQLSGPTWVGFRQQDQSHNVVDEEQHLIDFSDKES